MVDVEEQASLLNLESRELNPYWFDPAQPLKIPANPLHWKAHELQILLGILKKQASKNPAQFNSKNYIDTLNEYTICVTLINEGKTAHEVMESGGLDTGGAGRSKAPAMGEGVAPSLDSGVSADNPLAG